MIMSFYLVALAVVHYSNRGGGSAREVGVSEADSNRSRENRNISRRPSSELVVGRVSPDVESVCDLDETIGRSACPGHMDVPSIAGGERGYC